MTLPDASRVRTLFAELRNLLPDERISVLDQQCSDEPLLRAEVESLLQFNDSDDESVHIEVLDHARLANNATAERSNIDNSFVGTQLGAYTLIRCIGHGASATVWEARQDHPRRHVALKLLAPSVLGSQRGRRFQREARLLGQLRHQSIAQVYDAGWFNLDHGEQPFVALELVPGLEFSEAISTYTLSPRAVVELMIDVCDAIAYAHNQGVIHRDLKPSNILIEERPGSGLEGPTATLGVKIIDFGVARTINASENLQHTLTQHGQLIGTIGYMSPEQAAGANHELDHRTDIYSIGVILFEALAGTLPHDLDGLHFPDAVLAIRDKNPATLISKDRRFRGDLNAILAKALQRDPDLRYENATQFAQDLRRYLAGQPVIARKPRFCDRCFRFARRNAGPLTAALIVMTSIAAGSFGVWYGFNDASKAYERYNRTFDAIIDSNFDMQTGSAVYNIPKLLNRYRSGDFVWQNLDPLRQARIQICAADLMGEVGEFDEAIAELQSAREKLNAFETLDDMLRLHAEDLHARAGAELYGLSQFMSSNQRFGLNELEQDLRRAEQQLGPQHDRTRQLDRIYNINRIRKDKTLSDDERISMLRAAVAGYDVNNAEAYPSVAKALAQLYQKLDRYDEALTLFQNIHDCYNSVEGNRHAVRKAAVIRDIGGVYFLKRDFETAHEHFQAALELMENSTDPENRRRIPLIGSLAVCKREMGDFDNAYALLTDAHLRRQRIFPPEHIDIQHSRISLANLHLLMNRNLERGEFLAQQAAHGFDALNNAAGRAEARFALACFALQKDELEKAERLIQETISIHVERENVDSWQHAIARAVAAEVALRCALSAGDSLVHTETVSTHVDAYLHEDSQWRRLLERLVTRQQQPL